MRLDRIIPSQDPSFPYSYKLVELIGRGSYAEVFKAALVDPATGVEIPAKPVAIKIILQSDSDNDVINEFEIILEQEKFFHNGTFVCHGKTPEGQPFIAMPFVRGKHLNEQLIDLKLVPFHLRMRLILNLLIQIDLMHSDTRDSSKTFHLDIKPENIIADLTTGDIRLIDYGLSVRTSQNISEEALDNDLINLSSIPGTVGYSAPEIFSKKATTASDIHSLTSILYLLLGARVSITNDFQKPSTKCLNQGNYHFYVPSEEAKEKLNGLLSWYNEEDKKELFKLIGEMQDHDPKKRPTAECLMRRFLLCQSAYIGYLSEFMSQKAITELLFLNYSKAAENLRLDLQQHGASIQYFAIKALSQKISNDENYKETEKIKLLFKTCNTKFLWIVFKHPDASGKLKSAIESLLVDDYKKRIRETTSSLAQYSIFSSQATRGSYRKIFSSGPSLSIEQISEMQKNLNLKEQGVYHQWIMGM